VKCLEGLKHELTSLTVDKELFPNIRASEMLIGETLSLLTLMFCLESLGKCHIDFKRLRKEISQNVTSKQEEYCKQFEPVLTCLDPLKWFANTKDYNYQCFALSVSVKWFAIWKCLNKYLIILCCDYAQLPSHDMFMDRVMAKSFHFQECPQSQFKKDPKFYVAKYRKNKQHCKKLLLKRLDLNWLLLEANS